MLKLSPTLTQTDLRLDRHALRMLLERNLIASAMHIFVAGLVAFVMAGSVPIWRSVFFFVLISSAIIFQMTLARRHAKSEWSNDAFIMIRRQFDVSAIVVGCMWGFAGFFLFPSGEPARQLFLTFVMGGMSLSAVGTQGSSASAHLSSSMVEPPIPVSASISAPKSPAVMAASKTSQLKASKWALSRRSTISGSSMG